MKQHQYLRSFYVFLTCLCVQIAMGVLNTGCEQSDTSVSNKQKGVRKVGEDK